MIYLGPPFSNDTALCSHTLNLVKLSYFQNRSIFGGGGGGGDKVTQPTIVHFQFQYSSERASKDLKMVVLNLHNKNN